MTADTPRPTPTTQAGRCPHCKHAIHNQDDCIRCTCPWQQGEPIEAITARRAEARDVTGLREALSKRSIQLHNREKHDCEWAVCPHSSCTVDRAALAPEPRAAEHPEATCERWHDSDGRSWDAGQCLWVAGLEDVREQDAPDEEARARAQEQRQNDEALRLSGLSPSRGTQRSPYVGGMSAPAEAHDATGPLREALDRIDRRAAQQMNDASAEPFEWCARIVSAALAAAPPEPRWPPADDEQAVRELTNAMEDNYTMGGLDDPTHVEARRILAALREGAER